MAHSARFGNFCLPKSDRVRRELLRQTRLESMSSFMSALDIIGLCALASILAGVLYLGLVQCCPQGMNYVAVVLGALVSAGLGFAVARQPIDIPEGLKVAIVGVLMAVALLLLLSLLVFRKHLAVNGIFLNHATRFVAQQPAVLLHVLTLMVFTGGLVALTVFEFLAVWSEREPAFSAARVYYTPEWTPKAVALSAVIGLQLYWGLAFLKELCKCGLTQSTSWWAATPSTSTST